MPKHGIFRGRGAPSGSVEVLPVFLGMGTADSTVAGAGTLEPTWPTHLAGDVGLLFVANWATDAAPSAPAGWAAVDDSPQTNPAANGIRLSVFWKRAASASETTPSIADPGNHGHAVMGLWRGCHATDSPWDDTAGDGVNISGTVTVPGGTTVGESRVIVMAFAWGLDAADAGAGEMSNYVLSNITTRYNAGTTDGNGSGIYIATGDKDDAGEYPASTTTINASSQARISIALRP